MVDGVEALIRLEDGIALAVGPATFIPIAESSGLIVPLGAWVAREACRQQQRWQADGLPLTVSVNVSALQFRRAKFADFVPNIIDASSLPLPASNLQRWSAGGAAQYVVASPGGQPAGHVGDRGT